jgi:predicted ATPase
MLKKLRLHNFRTYLNTELSFKQRHLIIGRNNSGKSNLFFGLRFLGATAANDLAKSSLAVPGGAWEITNWALKANVFDLSCECELLYEGQPHQFAYDLKIAVEPSTGSNADGGQQLVLRVASEQLTVRSANFGPVVLLTNNGREASMLHEEDFAKWKQENRPKTLAPRDATMLSKLYELETNRRAIHFRRYLSAWNFFNLIPDAMRFGWRDTEASPGGLTPNGNNLALVIHQVKNADERRYRRIIEHVRNIEPDLEAINFNVSVGQVPIPYIALKRRPQASWVGLSDGTLRCLAMAYLAEVVRPYDGSFVLPFAPLFFIEEPENGVSPGQLRYIYNLFEEAGPVGQFISSSHSPYFINFFDSQRDSVTVLRRNNERTEIVPIPPPDESDPERILLAEQYAAELFD